VHRRQHAATDHTVECRPGVTGYAGGENQRMLSSFAYKFAKQ